MSTTEDTVAESTASPPALTARVAARARTATAPVRDRLPSPPRPSFVRAYASLWLAVLCYMVIVDPVLAQTPTPTGGASCDGPFIKTVRNATMWLTVAGPTVGGANAGYNMLKASGTNKSGKKKEYKENIRSSIVYGLGAGMVTAVINLISRWAPVATC